MRRSQVKQESRSSRRLEQLFRDSILSCSPPPFIVHYVLSPTLLFSLCCVDFVRLFKKLCNSFCTFPVSLPSQCTFLFPLHFSFMFDCCIKSSFYIFRVMQKYAPVFPTFLIPLPPFISHVHLSLFLSISLLIVVWFCRSVTPARVFRTPCSATSGLGWEFRFWMEFQEFWKLASENG